MSLGKKVADDIFMVPWSEGNGQIRREVWIDEAGKIERYDLSYLNMEMVDEDQGKVLGYGVEKGVLLVHRMGKVTPVEFTTLEEMEERFAIEWNMLPKQNEPVVTSTASSGEGAGHDEYQETIGMKLTITKGSAADFFARGRDLARRIDGGDAIEPEKVVIFGDRHDLCYSQMPRR